MLWKVVFGELLVLAILIMICHSCYHHCCLCHGHSVLSCHYCAFNNCHHSHHFHYHYNCHCWLSSMVTTATDTRISTLTLKITLMTKMAVMTTRKQWQWQNKYNWRWKQSMGYAYWKAWYDVYDGWWTTNGDNPDEHATNTGILAELLFSLTALCWMNWKIWRKEEESKYKLWFQCPKTKLRCILCN